MIILVKVNQTYIPGTDPKIAAYRSWGCSRLLDDPAFRNQYKYVVAYYFGQIVGTFCIHGISLDTPHIGNKRKVKFLLEDTDTDCDQHLKTIVNTLIASRNQKILRAISFCYIDAELLNQNNISIATDDCKCALNEIPIVNAEKIYHNNSEINDNESIPALPKNIWLKITSLSSSFDSFRRPHSVEIKTIIVYNPNDKVDFIKTDNSSGADLVIKNTVDTNEIRTIKLILATFHSDPNKAIDKINRSAHSRHVAHYNGFDIEFEAFADKNMTTRIQHAKWSGNILIVENGFLKFIYDLMA